MGFLQVDKRSRNYKIKCFVKGLKERYQKISMETLRFEIADNLGSTERTIKETLNHLTMLGMIKEVEPNTFEIIFNNGETIERAEKEE